MLLSKTMLAREALQAGSSAGLGMLERRILILTDGKRSLNEVMDLVGSDVLPVIDRLMRAGYICDARFAAASPAAMPAAQPSVAGALTGLLRATTEAVQARTERTRTAEPERAPTPATASMVAPSGAPARGAPTGQRRSLVAAKMYVVDMLQLQRHPDAVELKARIQFAGGQDELLASILDGMRVLLQLVNDSYGQRIVGRLREVLPDDLLPQLEATLAASGAAAAQERSAPPQLKLVGR